jgi:hypothetical protein
MDESEDLEQLREWRERYDKAWSTILGGWAWGLFGVCLIWASMTEDRRPEGVWIGVMFCVFGTVAIRWGRRDKRRLWQDIDAANAEMTE